MSKVMLVDCDGVLLNWFDAFLEYTKLNRDEFLKYDKQDPKGALILVENFNLSAACGFLKPISNDVLWGVRYFFEQGYDIRCITAFGGNQYSQQLRIENLNRYFSWYNGTPMISDVEFVPLGESKRNALLRYGYDSGIPFIEDHLKHAKDGESIGFKTFLFNRDYNIDSDSDNSSIIRVNTWKEITTWI